jgi:hypothetical protein
VLRATSVLLLLQQLFSQKTPASLVSECCHPFCADALPYSLTLFVSAHGNEKREGIDKKMSAEGKL